MFRTLAVVSCVWQAAFAQFEPSDPSYYATAAKPFGAPVAVSNITALADAVGATYYGLAESVNVTQLLQRYNASGPTVEGVDGHDYGAALGAAILFYEAQRAGRLPASNRVPWRGDSALLDPVLGGWYDAGDHLKLHFPLAFAAAQLAWGYIEFAQGYASAGEDAHLLDALHWVGQYLMDCHHDDASFTAQIGDVAPDHGVWGRAEDITFARPAYDVTPSGPGSDLLGAAVAALSAISMATRASDAPFAARCLAHARDLHALAKAYPGKYSDTVSQAFVYPSSSIYDDMQYGAMFLYRATMEEQFLRDARAFRTMNRQQEGGGGYYSFNWDDSNWGADALLAMLTGDADATQSTTQFVQAWVSGSQGVRYTPGGLAWLTEWGSLRHAMNAAFVALVWSQHLQASDPVDANRFACWARGQARYVLGDNPASRSYVVGVGANPPTHEHHAGASCPAYTTGRPCDFGTYADADANPNVLYGALVGGPDVADGYADVRSDYVKNEVAVDYNAGFTGVLAYLAGSAGTWQACLEGGYVLSR